jgi:hypothetical protein
MKGIGDKRPPATAGLPFAKTEAVKKPNFQNHFRKLFAIRSPQAIIRLSPDILFV